MQGIRAYTPQDAGQVVSLYKKMFLGGVPIETRKRRFLDGFFSRWMFEDPWRSEDLPSLVYESSDGALTGFLGVVPRELSFDDRRIRVAIAAAFMVDPGSRPAGIALLSHLVRGPQDLTLTEGATEHTRRILERIGFRAYPSMSVNWFRAVRPSLAALTHFTRSRTPSRKLLAGVGRPVCRLIDNVAASVPDLGTLVEPPRGVRSRPLSTAELLECIWSVSQSRRIRPTYDASSLEWVLELRRRAEHRGRFEQVAVVDDDGGLLGWYLCHLQRDGTSEVIQMGVLDDAMELVFARALYDCTRRGSALVQGRLEMSYLKEALINGCLFRPAPWMLARSANPAILDAIQAEEIFLSSLENELPW